MNIDEAIATLEAIKQFGIGKWMFDKEEIEAFDMAIEALQAQTDGDLISRKEVLEMIIVAGECEPDLGYTHLHDVIEALPSAEPKTDEWIPVSERLPIMRTEVIYSFDGIVSTGYMTDRDFNGEKMELHWEDLEIGATIEPIAWMPLPEPYREDGEA